MKRFFNTISSIHIANLILIFLLTFSSLLGFSSLCRTTEWKTAEGVSRYMTTSHISNTIFSLKSPDYPSFSYSSWGYFAYSTPNIPNDKKMYFPCSMADDKRIPFAISILDVSSPFIVVPDIFRSSTASINLFATTLFNKTKLSDLNSRSIYITKNTADKVLGKTESTLEEYEKLIGTKLKCDLVKNGNLVNDEFIIYDIVDKFKYSWINTLYGEDVVFGSQRIIDEALMDNFRIHFVISNDIYANSYIFAQDCKLLKEQYHYEQEFNIVENGILKDNSKLNSSILEAKLNTSVAMYIFAIIFALWALVSIFAIFIIYVKKNIYLFNYKWYPFYGALIFVITAFICFLLNNHLASLNISFFSPVGFLIGLIFFLFTILLSAIFSSEKNRFYIICHCDI